MKIGIIGLPQTGKKTLYQVLTGHSVPDTHEEHKALIGTADMRDPRFDRLAELYEPRSEVKARVDFVVLPRLEPDAIAKGDVFKDIAELDAVCHVVRSFEDESVYHVKGSVAPLRDIALINDELILHDLLFVETRMERIDEALKKMKDEAKVKERELLVKMKTLLEENKPLRIMRLSQDEEMLIRSYPFVTLKPMMIVLNVSDSDLTGSDIVETVRRETGADTISIMQVSAKVESEIDQLDDEDDRMAFFSELGIQESALEQLCRLCLQLLGLISFFTVGRDEVRQWLVKKGACAPEAAGAIHSDLQRGFIRAEVMAYDDLVEAGTESALKSAGKLLVKGKDYIVQDGDILNIRFKV